MMRLLIPAVLLAFSLCAPSQVNAQSDPRVRDVLERREPPWYDSTSDSWQPPRTGPPRRVQFSGDPSGWSAASAAPIAWILLGIVVAVLIAVMIRTWMERRASDEVNGPLRGRLVVRSGALELDIAEAKGDIVGDLNAALAAGDWRRVVILAFAKTLVELDRRGLIQLERGTTNRAYLGQAKKNGLEGDAPTQMLALIEGFERVYFGDQAADEVLARTMIASSDAVRAGSPRRETR